MNESEQENRFSKQIKKTLDDGSHRLDSETQSRLTQIRYKALESKLNRRFPEWIYQPLTQYASVACALLLIVLFFGEPGKVQVDPSLADIDLLTSTDVLELYEELEFYAWLAEENMDAG
jgi:hypothetical protein